MEIIDHGFFYYFRPPQ